MSIQLNERLHEEPTVVEGELPSIIESLGGLQHVVRLCLTHPDSDEVYTQQAVSTIKSCMSRITVTNSSHPLYTMNIDGIVKNINLDSKIDLNSGIVLYYPLSLILLR